MCSNEVTASLLSAVSALEGVTGPCCSGVGGPHPGWQQDCEETNDCFLGCMCYDEITGVDHTLPGFHPPQEAEATKHRALPAGE